LTKSNEINNNSKSNGKLKKSDNQDIKSEETEKKEEEKKREEEYKKREEEYEKAKARIFGNEKQEPELVVTPQKQIPTRSVPTIIENDPDYYRHHTGYVPTGYAPIMEYVDPYQQLSYTALYPPPSQFIVYPTYYPTEDGQMVWPTPNEFYNNQQFQFQPQPPRNSKQN